MVFLQNMQYFFLVNKTNIVIKKLLQLQNLVSKFIPFFLTMQLNYFYSVLKLKTKNLILCKILSIKQKNDITLTLQSIGFYFLVHKTNLLYLYFSFKILN